MTPKSPIIPANLDLTPSALKLKGQLVLPAALGACEFVPVPGFGSGGSACPWLPLSSLAGAPVGKKPGGVRWKTLLFIRNCLCNHFCEASQAAASSPWLPLATRRGITQAACPGEGASLSLSPSHAYRRPLSVHPPPAAASTRQGNSGPARAGFGGRRWSKLQKKFCAGFGREATD